MQESPALFPLRLRKRQQRSPQILALPQYKNLSSAKRAGIRLPITKKREDLGVAIVTPSTKNNSHQSSGGYMDKPPSGVG